MKKLLLMVSLVFTGLHHSNAQVGELRVSIVPPGSSVSAVPNDQITFSLPRTGEPVHNCVVFSRIMYTFSYKLINQSTMQVYDIGDDYLYANGWSCSPTIAWHEGTSTSSATVPCNIPTGSYWLSIDMKDVLSFTVNNGGYSIPNTDPYIWGPGTPAGTPGATLYVTASSTTQGPFHQDLSSTTAMFSNLMTVNVTNSNLFDVGVTTGVSNCLGTATANIITGGTAPFSYQWTPTPMANSYPFPLASTTQAVTGLAPDVYNVKVTDANGCYAEKEFTITDHNVHVSGSQINSTCFGNGSIDISVTGGTPPYTYNWSNGATTQDISNLSEGPYTVTVSDAAGCTPAPHTRTITDAYASYDYPSGLTITSGSTTLADLNADGIIRIKGLLKIESGVTYTISNKILEFAVDPALEAIIDDGYTGSGIVVKNNAILNFNNSTARGITGCNSMWSGIQIWGDPASIVTTGTHTVKNIMFYNESSLNHGKLFLNNSTVQDAHIGVACYRRDLAYLVSSSEYGRGILMATSSTFTNNNIAVDFQSNKGYNINNKSVINRCTFTANAALINTAMYNSAPSHAFVRMNRTHGVKVTGNTFTGTSAYAVTGKVLGILSYDASYQVLPSTQVNGVTFPAVKNTFKDLYKGLDIYSVGGTNNTVKIRDNKFEAVYKGITANSSNFDEISLNIFEVPQGTSTQEAWGIYLVNSKGFLVTENNFKSPNSFNPYTYGMLSKNTAISTGQSYKNTHPGNFTAAAQIELDNTKLQLQCNGYTGNNSYDWAVTSGQLANQGSCTSGLTSANNVFGTCSGAATEQINLNAGVPSFTYYGPTATLPTCITGAIVTTGCSVTASCPTKITATPCDLCPVPGLATTYASATGLTKEIVRADLLRDYARNEDIASLISLLQTENQQDDIEILVPVFWGQNNFYEARQALNAYLTPNTEKRKFKDLFDVLITLGESSRTPDQLTPAELTIITDIANTSTRVSGTANAILAGRNKSIYTHTPERIRARRNALLTSSETEGTETLSSMIIYPNPAATLSTVSFGKEMSGKLSVISMTGQIIETATVNDQTELTLNTSNWGTGIYLVLFENANGTSEQQKLVITK